MEKNVGSVSTTNMENNVPAYEVASAQTDAATGQKETEYINTKASQYLGYYKNVPQLNVSIKNFATWIVGKGYEAEDPATSALLDNITGWGEDTFNSIIWNLMICKKIYGDAFAHIIRDSKTGKLLNIKPLDPSVMKIVADERGIILRYEQTGKTDQTKGQVVKNFKPNEILHLCNDRVADEIHGTSIIEACESVILMIQQILNDYSKVLHRNVVPVRVMEVDTDDPTKINELKAQYELNVKNGGELIMVPKGTVSFSSDGSITAAIVNPMPFLNYLDNFFYQVLGVPKIILGGGQEFTEASSKIAYVSYEQVYVREQTEFIADLWNQCQIKIKLNKPVSLQNELITDNTKDSGQMGFQPNDMQAGAGA